MAAFLLEECLPEARRAPERARAFVADLDALCDAWRPFAPQPRALFKVRDAGHLRARARSTHALRFPQAVLDAAGALAHERAAA
jgi:hypothetical protein